MAFSLLQRFLQQAVNRGPCIVFFSSPSNMRSVHPAGSVFSFAWVPALFCSPVVGAVSVSITSCVFPLFLFVLALIDSTCISSPCLFMPCCIFPSLGFCCPPVLQDSHASPNVWLPFLQDRFVLSTLLPVWFAWSPTAILFVVLLPRGLKRTCCSRDHRRTDAHRPCHQQRIS